MSNPPASVSFNYNALPHDLADDARKIAGRIRARIKIDYIATGHDLIEMKERLGHGQFGAWLEAKFGLSDRTAERYMAVARFDAANSDIVSELLPATMHMLAAPSLPEQVRAACIGRVKAGEHLRPKDVAEIASEARHRTKQEEARIKRLPKGKVAREQVMAEQEDAAKRREARDAAEERARVELVALIVDSLGDAGDRALLLLNRIPSYNINGTLKAALEMRGVAP